MSSTYPCLALTLTLLILTTGCTSSQQVQSAPSFSTAPEAAKPIATSGHITAQAPSAQPSTTVLSVGDGDTLRVRQNGKTITVRAACTDAPERQQQGGKEATQRLKELLPMGTRVALRSIDVDRYGRQVAEIYRDGRSINLTMVRSLSVV